MINYTVADIERFVCEHKNNFQFYIVAQTAFRPYNKTAQRIEQAHAETEKALRYSLNCFSSEINYGHASRAKRKPHTYRPSSFCTIECFNASALRDKTMHANILIGNLPKFLTAQHVQTLFRHCWTEKAKQADDVYVTSFDGSDRLIGYTLKEGTKGNVNCWSVENTFIPRSALHTD